MQLSKNKNYLHLRFLFQCWRILETTTANSSSVKENQIILLAVRKSKLGEEQDQ